ncbi:hypothetical protein GQ457_13G013650 [Hibiscus cannabinus]
MRDVIVISPDYSFVRIKITKSRVEGSNNGSRSVTHLPQHLARLIYQTLARICNRSKASGSASRSDCGADRFRI